MKRAAAILTVAVLLFSSVALATDAGVGDAGAVDAAAPVASATASPEAPTEVVPLGKQLWEAAKSQDYWLLVSLALLLAVKLLREARRLPKVGKKLGCWLGSPWGGFLLALLGSLGASYYTASVAGAESGIAVFLVALKVTGGAMLQHQASKRLWKAILRKLTPEEEAA